MRRVPNCAWCGGPLKKTIEATLIVSFDRYPGIPRIGWAGDKCFKADPAAEYIMRTNKPPESYAETQHWLEVVRARGPDRVSYQRCMPVKLVHSKSEYRRLAVQADQCTVTTRNKDEICLLPADHGEPHDWWTLKLYSDIKPLKASGS